MKNSKNNVISKYSMGDQQFIQDFADGGAREQWGVLFYIEESKNLSVFQTRKLSKNVFKKSVKNL